MLTAEVSPEVQLGYRYCTFDREYRYLLRLYDKLPDRSSIDIVIPTIDNTKQSFRNTCVIN